MSDRAPNFHRNDLLRVFAPATLPDRTGDIGGSAASIRQVLVHRFVRTPEDVALSVDIVLKRIGFEAKDRSATSSRRSSE